MSMLNRLLAVLSLALIATLPLSGAVLAQDGPSPEAIAAADAAYVSPEEMQRRYDQAME